MPGLVIVCNGPSSAGKSALMHAFSVHAPTPFAVLDDAARPGFARATIRWLVIRIPAWIAIALGAWWVGGIWLVVVYGPILFTPLRQGLHDRAAGVVVVMRREVGERWTLANLAHRVRR
jgi:uncharacterized RDD family membrane protein YckC